MSHDTRWRVGDTIVDGLLSGQPTWIVGNSETLEFYVGEESVDGRPKRQTTTEGTYGGALPFTYGRPLPATYDAPYVETETGEVRPYDEAYRNPDDSPYGQLRKLVQYAGSATTQMSVDGVPLVREQIPERSDLDSHIVAIEPIGEHLAWASGAWVLVTGARDTSHIAEINAHLTVELQVTVLAPLTEYASRSDLRADMAPPVVPED